MAVNPATIQAARAGDREALAALLRGLADPWYRMALATCGNADAAAEATQEAAMRLLRDIGRFRGKSQFRTWAIGILLNVVRERRRVERRPADRPISAQRTHEAADAMAEQNEQQQILRDLLADLPERQREALVLRFFEDLSIDQAAQVMNCAAGTVKATVHQALRSLRQRLMRCRN